jgi:hypothetical protein
MLLCHGADFMHGYPFDLSSLYASDRFFFQSLFACDPTLDYSQWANLKRARFLDHYLDLSVYAATQKQLALLFGFEVLQGSSDGRVLVYSQAGLLADQKLVDGDNQFLLEIESLDLPFSLYFVHAGGSWLFTGLSGYVV